MITVDGLRALRVSATLAHALPALRVRLSDHHGVRVEVAATAPDAGSPAGALRLTPCQYRMAVAKGWSMQQDGRPIRMLDLSGDPVVEIGVPPGGATLASGIQRVPLGGRHLFVAATSLSVDAVEDCVGEGDLDDDLAAMAELWGVALRADLVTGVTVIWAELDAGDRGLQHALLDTLERVVVRVAVTELVAGPADAAPSREH